MAIIHEVEDAPYSLNTPYSVELGDSFLGNLTSGDLDLVRIELTAGTTYELRLAGRGEGDPLDDPALTLWDSDVTNLAFNDDASPDNPDSLLKVTPSVSGTFYIGISSSHGESGDYELTVVEGIPDPEPVFAGYDAIARQITDGFWEWQGFIRHSFDVEPGGTLDVDITALTAEGQQLARWALEAWSDVTGISFHFVHDADAHIVFDDNQPGGFAGATRVMPDGRVLSSQVNVSEHWLTEYGASLDSYVFQAYLHEIGHALGLGHPGNYPADFEDPRASYGFHNLFANDSWQATLMSYFSQTENTAIDADYAHAVTPMIADIIAIQDLYGTPSDVRPGDDVYGANSNVGGYLGELFALVTGERADPDVHAGGPIALTLYDTGGTDTLDLHTDTGDQRVDLRMEGVSSVFGLSGNLVIARDTVIEHFIAGSGDDAAIGNAAANRMEGRAGDDHLDGGSGDDSLIGGDGDDTLLARGGNDLLEGGRGEDSLEGGAGDDTLRGGAGSDRLNGGTNNDSLYGEAGDDRLIGGLGDDLILGSVGDDKLIGAPGRDTLEGGEGSDTLFGNAGDDRLHGGESDDTLNGGWDADEVRGEAGDDRLIGGLGDDRLFGGTGDDKLIGASGNDSIHGEAGDDTLFGNAGDDLLLGGDGTDRLSGSSGQDTLDGGAGADRLVGGAGEDVFLFANGSGDDTIEDFVDGEDRIDLSGLGLPNGFADLTVLAVEGAVLLDLSFHGGGTVQLQRLELDALDMSDFLV